jgi:hypothetical protein
VLLPQLFLQPERYKGASCAKTVEKQVVHRNSTVIPIS